MFTYIAVADEITRRLRGVRGGRDFDSWINATVGGLRPTPAGKQIIETVCRLGTLIVTTNYDTLIEDLKPEWTSRTWTDSEYAAANTETQIVVHLHGIAENPDSIILSSADYQRLNAEQLTQVLNKSLFASRRFIFIGCGDGLNDPDIAPLIDFVNKAMPKESKAEHYILVRGNQLRQYIERELSPRIVPVAYGSTFGDLTSFLRKLADDEEIEASQTPTFYEQPPNPGTALLDLAGPAQEKLQRALDALEQAMRGMGRVEHRSALPLGIDDWKDYKDQEIVHKQLAASVADPAAHLESCSDEVVLEFEQAEVYVGRLTAGQFTRDAARLAPMIAVVTELEDLCNLLLSRVTKARDDLDTRTRERCSDYRVVHKSLERSYKSIRQATIIAGSMKKGLVDLEEVQAMEKVHASRSNQAPETYTVTTALRAIPESEVLRVPVVGKAAAGDAVLSEEEQEYLPLPARYVRHEDARAVKVTGDSMVGDGILEDDYVIVIPTLAPANGEIVVVVVEGVEGVEEGEAMVKRFQHRGATIQLKSSNSKVATITVNRDAIQAIYQVIGVVRWDIT